MHWIKAVLGLQPAESSQADHEAFIRREAELRERHNRLERLAAETDVIRQDYNESNSDGR